MIQIRQQTYIWDLPVYNSIRKVLTRNTETDTITQVFSNSLGLAIQALL